jgi:hypothetical protein
MRHSMYINNRDMKKKNRKLKEITLNEFKRRVGMRGSMFNFRDYKIIY